MCVVWCCDSLSALAPHSTQVAVIRESMATVYEAQEAWSQAAQVLAGIDLDSGQRVLDASYKLQMCIRIAQLFLVRMQRRGTGMDVSALWLTLCASCHPTPFAGG